MTRRGVEAAVLIPIDEWRRRKASSRPTLKQLLLAPEARDSPESLAGRRIVNVDGAAGADADPRAVDERSLTEKARVTQHHATILLKSSDPGM